MTLFSDCRGLTSITIPESVVSIKDGVFSGCTGLTSITIPNSVTSIGNSIFAACYNLASITISDSLKSIGDYAFFYCYNLTSITIPNGMLRIGDQAFNSCYDLTSITIPASVTSIGETAFYNCTGLISIDVDNANPSYSSEEGVLFDKEKTKLISFPTGKSGDYKIPPNVSSIKYSAFYNCKGLTSITIPENVTNIEWAAFYGCTGLLSVINQNSVPINIDYFVFWDVDKNVCVLKVPTCSVDLYKNAPVWQDFSQITDYTSIETIASSNDIRVSPTLVLESFRIDGIDKNTAVTLLDMSGKIVLQQIVAPNEIVSVAQLPKGTYIVHMADNAVKIIKR